MFRHRFCGASGLLKHMRSYHGDNVKALTKSKELEIHTLLQSKGIPFEYQHYLQFHQCGLDSNAKHAFVDFVINKARFKVLLEIDENMHRAQYATSCDLAREMNILGSVALGSADKLVMIRYNPDSYTIGGVVQNTSRRERETKLLQVLEDLEQEPDRPYTRLFLYYSRPAADSPLPCIAESWPLQIQQISLCLA